MGTGTFIAQNISLVKNTPANNTISWQVFDREHHLHPFTDTKALAKQGCRVITRADGVYIWDSEGNRLLVSRWR